MPVGSKAARHSVNALCILALFIFFASVPLAGEGFYNMQSTAYLSRLAPHPDNSSAKALLLTEESVRFSFAEDFRYSAVYNYLFTVAPDAHPQSYPLALYWQYPAWPNTLIDSEMKILVNGRPVRWNRNMDERFLEHTGHISEYWAGIVELSIDSTLISPAEKIQVEIRHSGGYDGEYGLYVTYASSLEGFTAASPAQGINLELTGLGPSRWLRDVLVSHDPANRSIKGDVISAVASWKSGIPGFTAAREGQDRIRLHIGEPWHPQSGIPGFALVFAFGVASPSGPEAGFPYIAPEDDHYGSGGVYLSIHPHDMNNISERRLDARELGLLTRSQLGFLRNAFYARHGYPFKNPELRSFFSDHMPYYSQWKPRSHTTGSYVYADNPNWNENLLTAEERFNVELIRQLEDAQ